MVDRFQFVGSYRVQSRRTPIASSLTGEWLECRQGLLTEEVVNAELCRHSRWTGRETVTLRPAVVSHRTGQFATEHDILYKRCFFTPIANSPAMPMDIVDVRKSERLWEERKRHLRSLFGPDGASAIDACFNQFDVIVANEYYLHEAGHFLGWDVLAKYNAGYFIVGGKTAWPLIYLEELRADLEGFGLAGRLLSPERAVFSFLYTISLRLGVHLAGVREKGIAPYGTIPYLLFHLLRELGFLKVAVVEGKTRLVLTSLDTDFILAIMEKCGLHAETSITGPELTAGNPLDAAICGASYVRSRVCDLSTAEEFESLMQGCPHG